MKIEKCTMDSFVVIGKKGSTEDGPGFIQKLWEEANGHFGEIQHLAKKDENGNIVGIWGAMSDFAQTFQPWEDGFCKGLYLAGVECVDDANAPEGWEKWTIPAYEYLYVQCEELDVFARVIAHMEKEGLELVGAVNDFTCPETGKNFMFFPIKKL